MHLGDGTTVSVTLMTSYRFVPMSRTTENSEVTGKPKTSWQGLRPASQVCQVRYTMISGARTDDALQRAVVARAHWLDCADMIVHSLFLWHSPSRNPKWQRTGHQLRTGCLSIWMFLTRGVSLINTLKLKKQTKNSESNLPVTCYMAYVETKNRREIFFSRERPGPKLFHATHVFTPSSDGNFWWFLTCAFDRFDVTVERIDMKKCQVFGRFRT